MKTILCLDIGNTHVFGGTCSAGAIQLRFRYPAHPTFSVDQIGLFLTAILKENQIDPLAIQAVAISSVVPALDCTIHSACLKYLKLKPFQIGPATHTGLQLNIQQPAELGADRIANAVAAIHHFPNEPLIIIDFGTATTLCFISQNRSYLGGAIMPGCGIARDALYQKAAQLMPVDIIQPNTPLGTCTTEQIQSGLYYGQLGALKELLHQLNQATRSQSSKTARIIATGGYAKLFKDEGVYSEILPDLTLEGLYLIFSQQTIPDNKTNHHGP